MGLLETAAADLQAILADAGGGFAVPIQIVAPDGRTVTINGQATDIGLSIDPETGMAVSGRKASVALPIRALNAAGIGQPCGVSGRSANPWRVKLTLPTGGEQTFKVSSSAPDKLGCLICFLEAFET